jgi:hypothetical protein
MLNDKVRFTVSYHLLVLKGFLLNVGITMLWWIKLLT